MNINRMNKYIIPQTSIILMCGGKYDFNLKRLLEYYNKRQFIFISEFINREYNWSCNNKEYTLKYFRLLIKIKQRFRYKKNIINKKRCKVANELDLMLNEFETKDTLCIYSLSLGIIHRFTLNDIIKIIENSLNYTELGISKVIQPMNPYNNIVFSLGQIIEIYQYVLKQYCRIGRVIPTYIVNYKSVYFDIEKYKATYDMKNNIHAYMNYISTLNNNEWVCEYYMNVYVTKNKQWCMECLLRKMNIENIRKLFTPVLVLAYLNKNSIMEFGRYKILHNKIIEKYNIDTIHIGNNDHNIDNISEGYITDGYTTEEEEIL